MEQGGWTIAWKSKIIARNRNYRFANRHGRKLISASGITGPRLLITVHQLTVTNGFFVNNTAGVIADTRVYVLSPVTGEQTPNNNAKYEMRYVSLQLRACLCNFARKNGGGERHAKKKRGKKNELKSSLPLCRSQKIAIVFEQNPLYFSFQSPPLNEKLKMNFVTNNFSFPSFFCEEQ